MTRVLVKGITSGVGATTIAANLTYALNASGRTTAVVDLDPRNILGMWFGQNEADPNGWVYAELTQQSWMLGGYVSPQGVRFFPFGDLFQLPSDIERLPWSNLIESLLQRVLPAMLTALSREYEFVVLSFPAMFNAKLLSKIKAFADTVLTVIHCDPVSFSLLRRPSNQAELADSFVVANQCSVFHQIQQDLLLLNQGAFAQRFISTKIHFDIAVQEALTSMTSVVEYSPNAQASHDFRALATWLVANASKQTQSS
ncbi:cellulose biosynthesis protein BcsQ [Motilimonas pumila]|uniref:Cellulose synthase operon protein YhjQ n=1 Tax=Motilimonas pumila TaxID=2303987 RepID=A0A418YFT3_9GAMM|nr:cellulose biosynthesis protein BcsQ [Motilimonas pumila]RJG48401.1 cellulose synthase operon protein YhjQ [Motilimonas pumila]